MSANIYKSKRAVNEPRVFDFTRPSLWYGEENYASILPTLRPGRLRVLYPNGEASWIPDSGGPQMDLHEWGDNPCWLSNFSTYRKNINDMKRHDRIRGAKTVFVGYL